MFFLALCLPPNSSKSGKVIPLLSKFSMYGLRLTAFVSFSFTVMFALCFVSAVLLSEEEEGDDKGVEEVENEAAEAVVPGAVEEEDDNAGVEDGVCIKRTLEL